MKRSLILLIAIALAAPAPLVAAWGVHGSFEPDTPQDKADSFMFATPDTDPNANVKKVYFNTVLTYVPLGANPNVGAAQTRLMVEGFQGPIAYLGIWKDCNDDGYIGLAEGVVTEYRAELLASLPVGDSICTEGGSAHNRDGWVYEFLWIGPADVFVGAGGKAQRLVEDPGAYVWGDTGLPGGDVAGETCFVNPPTGTFSSTGGILGWQDCGLGRAAASTINAVDGLLGGNTGLAFEDERAPGCSSSALNVRVKMFADDPRCPSSDSGLLEEHADSRAFTTWDCSEPTRIAPRDPTSESGRGDLSTITDPTGGELDIVFSDEGTLHITNDNGEYAVVHVGTPAPNLDDPRGSYYDAANGATNPGSGCTGVPLVHATPESEVTSDEAAKREATFSFMFWNDIASDFTFGFGNVLTGILGLGDVPSYGGVGYAHFLGGQGLGAGWFSPVATTGSVLLRGDLSPAGASYYTFYARVTTPITGAVPSGNGVYGAEWCNGATTGELNGFDCDATNWYRPDLGASSMPTGISGNPIGQVPGSAYNLRDIDCYDGSVLGTPVAVGGASLSTDGFCPAVG